MTIYRLIESGVFPAPTRKGRNGWQIRWPESVIDEWIQENGIPNRKPYTRKPKKTKLSSAAHSLIRANRRLRAMKNVRTGERTFGAGEEAK